VRGFSTAHQPFVALCTKMAKWGMNFRRLLLISLILVLGFLLVAPSSAQPSIPYCDQVEYFPETSHNVCDQFLEFFDARGGAGIFGYPITEQFVENGRLVQYFQRVRMEYHPELSSAYQVQLGLLGDQFAAPNQKNRISESDKPKSNDPARRYFPETGHTAQFDFLEFFEKNGGLDNFGYPVTEFFIDNDRVVQYFQRALMEWNPNRGDIVLHNLGEMWVDAYPHLRPLRNSAPQLAPSGETVQLPTTITDLRASASVRNAYLGLEGDQTVWVYVNDQNGLSVQGAEVKLVSPTLPGVVELAMPTTDELGHTQATLSLPGLTPGQLVILEAQVSYQGLTATARTYFLVWL
jgi:hypothetical protein